MGGDSCSGPGLANALTQQTVWGSGGGGGGRVGLHEGKGWGADGGRMGGWVAAEGVQHVLAGVYSK
jgi:hypothetical protein